MFIKSEEFFTAPAETVAAALQFLQVEPAPIDTSSVQNHGIANPGMSGADRRFLVETFRSDIELVESLLGWDCRDWLT